LNSKYKIAYKYFQAGFENRRFLSLLIEKDREHLGIGIENRQGDGFRLITDVLDEDVDGVPIDKPKHLNTDRGKVYQPPADYEDAGQGGYPGQELPW
jgi:hypothetical protein